MSTINTLKRWISLSLNDPQWGRSKSDAPLPPPSAPPPPNDPRRPRKDDDKDSPPDLDDVVKQFGDKLGALFGRKTKRPNPFEQPPRNQPPEGNGGGGMNFPRLPLGGIGALIGIAALVWLASGFYIVEEGKRGIVLQFGKYVETTQPGPRWHFPYPIEAKEIVDISNVKSVEIGKKQGRDNRAALMLTEDLNIIEALVEVQYILKDAKEFAFNNLFARGGNPNDVIAQIAETSVREIIGKRKMDALLSQGGRADVAQQAQKTMQEILDRYKTGIQISKVNLQSIKPPDEVVEAFNDVNKAEQDRDRLRNEGQAYANDVIPKAKGTAARLREEATGYAASVVSRSEGDASRFRQLLGEYEKAPGVTRERLYIDMMQSVLGNTNKVFIDQKSGSNNLLYLPLDRLIERTRTEAGGGPAPTVTEPPRAATAEQTPSTSSDAVRDLRNRDLRGNR